MIETIIFDLDDTLYPSSSGIWSLIRERIDSFMINRLGYDEKEVPATREKFFRTYGTTLRGLETVHHIDPVEYLKFVHNIPLDRYLIPNHKLISVLEGIPQRKVIFTNGDRWHAKRVLDALTISKFFDEIVDILDISPYCKPMEEAFSIALEKFKIGDYNQTLLVDDNIRNIETAKKLGLKTVLVSENDHHIDLDILKIKKIEDIQLVFQTI